MTVGYEWRPYVPAAQRRLIARREEERLRKRYGTASPLTITGRKIAQTFWGQAWCDNLERYSDFENRLPRGRTYARNGSVIDLNILAGEIDALVVGLSVYNVSVKVQPVQRDRWQRICSDCAGGIDSLVSLLEGRLSKAVMERICRQGTGLFPAPDQMEFECTCPDWAVMCKHVAAVLYGVGARLDDEPELLFKLSCVDQRDLISGASGGLTLPGSTLAPAEILAEEDLSEVFGLELRSRKSATAAKRPKPEAARTAAGDRSGSKPRPSAKSSGAARAGARKARSSAPAERKRKAGRARGTAKSRASRRSANEGRG